MKTALIKGITGQDGSYLAEFSFEELVKLMAESDIAKVAAEGAAAKVRTNLAEYLEKGIVK